MATLKHIPSNGETGSNISTLNNYIADGHGNEVLARTNRYIDDGHGLVTTLRGYNCPDDPTLATEVMQNLLAQYEYNLAGRNTKGTNGTKVPVTSEHLILSFHKDDDVSPELGHKIFGELIGHTKLKYYAVLTGDHNNTNEFHIHGCTSVVDITGTRKLCLNNRLLNDLRRELDYICYEHGLSIVENSELFADEDYRKWFQKVKAEGKITIHPPLCTKERKNRRTKRTSAQEEENVPSITDENRGTHFYCLPHLYDPNVKHRDIKQPLYIYALDQAGDRRPPMQLAFDLERRWCDECIGVLEKKFLPGKKKIIQRLSDTRDSASDNIELSKKLDIATSFDLKRHLKGIGRDLTECRKYLDELNQNIQACDDNEKRERLEERKATTEKRETALRKEYRDLKKLEKMYENLLDPDEWSDYTTSLLKRSASRMTEAERTLCTLRWHYQDVGQMLGVSPAEIDNIIDQAQTMSPDAVLDQWVEVRGRVSIRFTKTVSGMSVLYESLGDLYAERRELRREHREYMREMSRALEDGGLVGIILLPLVILTSAIMTVNELMVDRQISKTRQLIEEIKWHNKNSKKQLEQAKSKCALMIAYGDYSAAFDAWQEFEKTCNEILDRGASLRMREMEMQRPSPDIPLEDQIRFPFGEAVNNYEAQILIVREYLRQQLEEKRASDVPAVEDFLGNQMEPHEPERKADLIDLIQQAEDNRSPKTTLPPKEKEQER